MGFRFAATALLVCAWFVPNVVLGQSATFRSASIALNDGRIPTDLAVGDFDEDGAIDAVTSNSSNGTATVFLQFDGEFFPSDDIQVGNVPTAVAVSDFDGDAHLDLLVANGNDASVVVLLGRGDGTFGTPAPAPCAEQGRRICVSPGPEGLGGADFDGDGRTDWVVASRGASEGAPGLVDLLLNNGDGTLRRVALDTCNAMTSRCSKSGVTCETAADCVALPAELGTKGVVTGDLNRDGRNDAVVVNSRSNSLSTFLGDGAGSLAIGSVSATGPEPQAVAVVDLNEDGILDAVTADKNADAVSVLRGNGSGSFGNRSSFDVATAPSDVAVADLDEDGNPDIVVTNNLSGDVSVLFGDGSGSLGRTRSFVADGQPVAVVTASVDGTAPDDVLTANIVGSDGSLAFLRNLGDGALQGVEDIPASAGPAALAVTDVDNDGLPDVVVGHDGGALLLYRRQEAAFGTPEVVATLGRPRALEATDLNGDEWVDLLVADNDAARLFAYLGDGKGALRSPIEVTTATGPADVDVGDFDGDGKLDAAIACLGPPGSVSIRFGLGDGRFSGGCEIPVGESPNEIVVLDFDRDGRDDFAVLNDASANVSVHRSAGSCTFTETAVLGSTTIRPISLVGGRLNGDELPDLAIGTPGSTTASVFVYTGKGDGTFDLAPGSPFPRDRAESATLRDFTGDGIVDLAFADSAANAAFVLRGNNQARFSSQSITNVSRMPIAIAAGDFDGDGRYDGVTANSQTTANNLSIMMNCVGDGFPCADASGSPVLRGDANGDGVVNAADLAAVGREVVDGDGRAIEDAGAGSFAGSRGVDANGDGIVTASDRRAVARRTFGGS